MNYAPMKDQVDPCGFTGKMFTRRKTFLTSVDDYCIRIDGLTAGRIMKKTLPGRAIWFWTLNGPYFPARSRMTGRKRLLKLPVMSSRKSFGNGRLGRYNSQAWPLGMGRRMTAQGVEFLNEWVSENVPPLPVTGDVLIRALAQKLRHDTRAAGFALADLEIEGPQLAPFIRETMIHVAEPGAPED